MAQIINIKKNGVDAYIVSIERGRVHIANLITNFHKYGLSQKDYEITASWEPLHRAAKNGDTTTVKNLLEAGAICEPKYNYCL